MLQAPIGPVDRGDGEVVQTIRRIGSTPEQRDAGRDEDAVSGDPPTNGGAGASSRPSEGRTRRAYHRPRTLTRGRLGVDGGPMSGPMRGPIVCATSLALLVACTAADPGQVGGDGGGDLDGEDRFAEDGLEVHFLDVGLGDATLLRHDEVAMLIDTGNWQRSDLLPLLEDHGVEGLDLIVVTHPHADHLGQFDQVVDQLEVAEVWWSGSETTTQTFERALTALEDSDARYEEPRTGDSTTLGPLDIEVVNPPEDVDLDDLHDAGLAMRVTYGDVALLFTGDAERATEARMVRESTESLEADVLQLGHHGSDTSTTSDLLEAVDPAVAVYSTSENNPYGHPHAEVLDRLEDAEVSVYGTPVHGTVTMATDGNDWTIRTEREGEPTPGPEGEHGDRQDEEEAAPAASTGMRSLLDASLVRSSGAR